MSGLLRSVDAIVIGSGPNGLAAAIAVAQAGLKPLVVERSGTIGGTVRSAGLTLPGFVHDVCSATGRQLLFRPALRVIPCATGVEGLYLCSSSTPPGGGVHGLCGWYAVEAAGEFLARHR